MLQKCQKKWIAKTNLSLVHGSAEDLPFADNSFDIVFHSGGINFFSDWEIENAIPHSVHEKNLEFVWDKKFYVITFRT